MMIAVDTNSNVCTGTPGLICEKYMLQRRGFEKVFGPIRDSIWELLQPGSLEKK